MGDVVKKKVLLMVVLCVFALTGVVSAASVWGTYKGNNILRLTVDGVPVKVSDVPAINYLGRTMIPIYLLQQAGIGYSWDAQNQTVNISKPSQQAQTQYINLAESERQSGRSLYLANNYGIFALTIRENLNALTIYSHRINGNSFNDTTQSDVIGTYDFLSAKMDSYENEFDKFSSLISADDFNTISALKTESESILRKYKKTMDLFVEADSFKGRDQSRSKTAFDKGVVEWRSTWDDASDLADTAFKTYIAGVNDVIN